MTRRCASCCAPLARCPLAAPALSFPAPRGQASVRGTTRLAPGPATGCGARAPRGSALDGLPVSATHVSERVGEASTHRHQRRLIGGPRHGGFGGQGVVPVLQDEVLLGRVLAGQRRRRDSAAAATCSHVVRGATALDGGLEGDRVPHGQRRPRMTQDARRVDAAHRSRNDTQSARSPLVAKVTPRSANERCGGPAVFSHRKPPVTSVPVMLSSQLTRCHVPKRTRSSVEVTVTNARAGVIPKSRAGRR